MKNFKTKSLSDCEIEAIKKFKNIDEFLQSREKQSYDFKFGGENDYLTIHFLKEQFWTKIVLKSNEIEMLTIFGKNGYIGTSKNALNNLEIKLILSNLSQRSQKNFKLFEKVENELKKVYFEKALEKVERELRMKDPASPAISWNNYAIYIRYYDHKHFIQIWDENVHFVNKYFWKTKSHKVIIDFIKSNVEAWEKY